MKNFDEFSNGIKLNESEIRFLNEAETELEQLGIELTTYMEDQDIKNPSYEVKGGALILGGLGDDVTIKKDGDKWKISMEHNPEETVEDIYGWVSTHVAARHADIADNKRDQLKYPD